MRGGVDRCAGWPEGHSSRMARSLYRSVTYGLEASLALAQTVARSGGRTDAATLASALSYSGVRNGAFLSRLANARLFGLVAGRSGQVVLTDRGRRCLSADPAVQHGVPWPRPAGRSLCSTVSSRTPRAKSSETSTGSPRCSKPASERTRPSPGRPPGSCSSRRGGPDSCGPEGSTSPWSEASITNFTDSDSDPGRAFAPSVRLPWNPHVRRVEAPQSAFGPTRGVPRWTMGRQHPSAEQPSDEGDLWIDEGTGSPRSRTNRRRTGIVLGVAACVALIGVPVGLLAASGPEPVPQASAHHHVTVSDGVAKRSVLAALSATTDSGNFAFTYQLNESPYQSSTSVEGPSCSGPACPATPVPQSTEVQGSGTIDTNPMAMAASAAISSNGVSGLQVGVRVDPTTVWEVGYADNGLTPESNDARRESLSQALPASSRERSARGKVRSP